MYQSSEIVESYKSEIEVRFETSAMALPQVHRTQHQSGFTLTELITVIVILGILAAVAVPRFFDRGTFDSRAFSDEIKSTLRLAQKFAIAQHRNVCVNVVTAAPSYLTINSSSSSPGSCDIPLPSLSGSGNYRINTRGSANLISSVSTLTFNALGSSGATKITLQVDTEPTIVVEKETGYVH